MPDRTGRPRRSESNARVRELLRLVDDGRSLVEAAREARVKPERVLRLLGEDGFLDAFLAVRRSVPAANLDEAEAA